MTHAPPPPSDGDASAAHGAAAPDRRLEAIFQQAADLAHAERARYLEQSCGDDTALRAKIDAMLAAFDDGTSDLLSRDATRLLTAPICAAGDLLLDRYRIVRMIAEGGMGTVFEAEQLEPLPRRVAVKVVRPGMDTARFLTRFGAERTALARMRHPSIAQVLDAGITPAGLPFFVMELLDGLPVTQACDELRLDLRARLRLFVRICRAVEHAHQKGVIHRDIKPSNVLVSVRDGEPEPTVIDFGIAKAVSADGDQASTRTVDGEIVGTPVAMSPEQLAGEIDAIDTRTDVYALGILLYEILTGSTPVPADELAGHSYLRQVDLIRATTPTRPSMRVRVAAATLMSARSTTAVALERRLRGDIDWIVMRCLEHDRERRYPSVGTLADDVQRHLDGEPVEVGPPGAGYRARKFVRRHRTVVAATVLVACTLLAATIVSSTGLLRARRAESAAEIRRQDAEDARRRADAMAAQLAAEVRVQRIERGRAATQTGNVDVAEEMLWSAMIIQPDDPRARWALVEHHVRHPLLASFVPHVEAHDGMQVLAFGPDARLLATAGPDAIHVWRTSDFRLVRTFGQGFGRATRLLVRGDRTLAAVSAAGELGTWDIDTGALRRLRPAHRGAAVALLHAPDGDVLSVGADGTARRWTGPDLVPDGVTALGEGTWSSAALAPDGRRLACGSEDGRIRIVPLDGVGATARLDGHTGNVLALAFTPDGRQLVSGSTDKSIRVWDLATGAATVLPSDNGSVRHLWFEDSGRTLVAVGWWRIDRWDLATRGRTPWFEYGGWGVARSATGLIALGSEDVLRVWDARTERGLVRLPPHDGPTVARTDPGGALLATGDSAGMLRLWRDLAPAGALRAHEGRCRAMAFDPRGTHLATAGDDGRVRVWALPDLEPIFEADDFDGASTGSVAFDARCELLAYGARDGALHVIELATGARSTAASTSWQVINVVFVERPEGTRLVTSARDRVLRLWTPRGASAGVLDNGLTPWSLAADRHGARLASGTWNKPVTVWDLDSGTPAQLIGHRATVWAVAWHPTDDDLLVTAADDGSIRVWSIGAGACVAMLEPFGGVRVTTVEFGADGRSIVAASGAGDVLVWDLEYFDRHIAGSLETQLARHGPAPRAAELRAWAESVRARPWPRLEVRPESRGSDVGSEAVPAD